MSWKHSLQYADLGEKKRTRSLSRPDPTDEESHALGQGREAATPVGSTANNPDQVGPTFRGDT